MGGREKTHLKGNVFGETVVLRVVEREDVDEPEKNGNHGPLRTRLERLQEGEQLGRREEGRGIDHEGTHRVLPARIPRIQLERERGVEVEEEEAEEVARVLHFLGGEEAMEVPGRGSGGHSSGSRRGGREEGCAARASRWWWLFG